MQSLSAFSVPSLSVSALLFAVVVHLPLKVRLGTTMKRNLLYLLVLGGIAIGSGGLLAAEKPNIIFILADDYGIPGVGSYGGIYKTPHIDALAAGGIRFEQCFSAPLCAPSRGLFMSGRYAFRTGVLDNGTGGALKPTDSVSVAKLLKQSGYATAQAGKWHQLTLMDTPEEATAWGFDEFLRWDRSKGERYWKPALNKNGQVVPVTDKSYGPDIFHEFVVDFIRRHREAAVLRLLPHATDPRPDLSARRIAPSRADNLYADNVAYLDKLVGKLVGELDALKLREKTLIVFVGDNGSTGSGSNDVHGRTVNGRKGSVLEGGSRVPLIVNWKGTTPAGRVLKDLVDFTDFYATFAEVAGAKLPEGVTFDGRSFAPQLRGEKGNPREWVYIQLGAEWYVRSHGWKLTQSGQLLDMSDAPFVEKPVAAADTSAETQAARVQLQAALDRLNPAGGIVAERAREDRDRRRREGTQETQEDRVINELKVGFIDG